MNAQAAMELALARTMEESAKRRSLDERIREIVREELQLLLKQERDRARRNGL